ncbi:response regulator [bacterium]|nr:response regulator [bacterium]
MTGKSKRLVYVVDDDDSVRQSLEMLLVSANVEVMAFESAKEFLEFKIRTDNACLITDISMKGISGLDLQKKLNDRGIEIPVIFLTAFDSNESREQARAEGATAYFRKPVDDQALMDAVKWALKSQSSSQPKKAKTP